MLALGVVIGLTLAAFIAANPGLGSWFLEHSSKLLGVLGVALLSVYLAGRFALSYTVQAKGMVRERLALLFTKFTDWNRDRSEANHRLLMEELQRLIPVALAMLAVATTLGGALVLLGTTASLAMLSTSYMQVERLDTQNALLKLQTRTSEYQQASQDALVRANTAFVEIETVLRNPAERAANHANALRRIPTVMKMRVPRFRGEVMDSGEIREIQAYEYPNLERSRNLLFTFLKSERGQSSVDNLLEDLNLHDRRVVELGYVSATIIGVLHQLGPTSFILGHRALINWVPDPDSASELPPDERPWPASTFDLRHMPPESFRGAFLPFLFSSSIKQDDGFLVLPEDVHLEHAQLAGAKLIGWNLARVKLSYADLRKTTFLASSLTNANLFAADLRRSSGIGIEARGAVFDEARMDDIYWPKSELARASFAGTSLTRAVLFDSDMSEATLSKTKLNMADLAESNLHKATIDEASIIGTDLRAANLSGASINEGSIGCSGLLNADLSDTTLKGVAIRATGLTGADLRGTSFSGVSLRGVDLTGVEMGESTSSGRKTSFDESVFSDFDTLMPHGFAGQLYLDERVSMHRLFCEHFGRRGESGADTSKVATEYHFTTKGDLDILRNLGLTRRIVEKGPRTR